MQQQTTPTTPTTPATPHGQHVTHYFVDNEPLETDQRGLKVREILSASGNEPPENYYLVEYHGQSQQEVKHENLDEFINIHEGHRFAAGYKGVTPLS